MSGPDFFCRTLGLRFASTLCGALNAPEPGRRYRSFGGHWHSTRRNPAAQTQLACSGVGTGYTKRSVPPKRSRLPPQSAGCTTVICASGYSTKETIRLNFPKPRRYDARLKFSFSVQRNHILLRIKHRLLPLCHQAYHQVCAPRNDSNNGTAFATNPPEYSHRDFVLIFHCRDIR